VNFLAHAVAEHPVDLLVASNKPKALKGWADNHGLKVMAIAVDTKVRAVEALAYVSFNVIWLNHTAILCLLGIKVFSEDSTKDSLKTALAGKEFAGGLHSHEPALFKKRHPSAQGLCLLEVMGG
jgi:hypothetical protein